LLNKTKNITGNVQSATHILPTAILSHLMVCYFMTASAIDVISVFLSFPHYTYLQFDKCILKNI